MGVLALNINGGLVSPRIFSSCNWNHCRNSVIRNLQAVPAPIPGRSESLAVSLHLPRYSRSSRQLQFPVLSSEQVLQFLNFPQKYELENLNQQFFISGLIYRFSVQLLERLLARNDLTEEEAEASLNFLLSTGSEALISSFLVLMRTKGETSEEVGSLFLFFSLIILDLLYDTKEFRIFFFFFTFGH